MKLRRYVGLNLAALLAGLGLSVGTAPSASAACSVNCIVTLWYNSNGAGACYNHTSNISNYDTRRFDQNDLCGGAGYGQYVKNNTASVTNVSDDTYFCMYENSGYKGRMQRLRPDAETNLNSALKNNNAAGRWC